MNSHSRGRSVRIAVAITLGVALLGGSPVIGIATAQAPAAQQVEAGLEPLTIVTASGSHAFSVEVMRTDEERAKGLMFRRFMPQDRGMLFDFKREEPIAMWMKNTYLPLDMVFMNRAGRVTHIAQNAEPLSERIIPSGGPVYAVLEINAGVAKAIGIKVGDNVQNALFRK